MEQPARCRSTLNTRREGAYKAIDDVMAAQEDLVEIVHTLRQVLYVADGVAPASAVRRHRFTDRTNLQRVA